MFELTNNEIEDGVSQNVIPFKTHLGGASPFAFTENGVATISSVLNSKRAIEIKTGCIVILSLFDNRKDPKSKKFNTACLNLFLC